VKVVDGDSHFLGPGDLFERDIEVGGSQEKRAK
jgi:hypothetical protein